MYRINIQRAEKKVPAPSNALLRQWAKIALAKEVKTGEITIRIVTVGEVAQLNETYRHKAGPTNVLSFPFTTIAPATDAVPYLGDIVIAAEIVNQEARQLNIENHSHWSHMVIHGVLHLLGHDHVHDDEALKMERLEINILAELGISNPYEHGDNTTYHE